MARSTKTKHVLNLVGAEPVKKSAPQKSVPMKPAASEKVEKAPPVPKIVEELEQQHLHEPVSQEEAVREEIPEEPVQEEAPAPVTEEKESAYKPIITAIVCELINQELGSVAERFHLPLTDGNLWELTKAALEEVRPEFSADSDDREEKLERLRPLVIGSMAKAAIKISAKGRK